MSSICVSVLPLEYQEAGEEPLSLPLLSSFEAPEPSQQVVVGVPADEVEQRIRVARDSAVAEADQRAKAELEHLRISSQEKLAATLKAFEHERSEYLKQIEAEVVQLALSIARKILQREAQQDPTLLAALVRIAIERMQCSSVVRIRVAPEDAERWRTFGNDHGVAPRWEVSPDKALTSGDCFVETELGIANFGFEAQMRDVEESVMQLLAHRRDT